MNGFDIKDLYAYLDANIEDFEAKLDRAIARGYKSHISPDQVDKNLTSRIRYLVYEYTEEVGLDKDVVDDMVTNNEIIDSIFFM